MFGAENCNLGKNKKARKRSLRSPQWFVLMYTVKIRRADVKCKVKSCLSCLSGRDLDILEALFFLTTKTILHYSLCTLDASEDRFLWCPKCSHASHFFPGLFQAYKDLHHVLKTSSFSWKMDHIHVVIAPLRNELSEIILRCNEAWRWRHSVSIIKVARKKIPLNLGFGCHF